ncbi:ISNCY family transposase [Treponema pectinovorum]|uniref:ISNCY family transposase n=1 Tax=Treponema pectinovorum TaxID=164 RepID=UPI0011F3B67F|nr:ISNCY family transposase [Treponema pectinovorum]
MNAKLTEQQETKKKLVLRILNEELTTKEATIEAGLTVRAIQKIVKKYKKNGEASFIHGNTGRIREDLRRLNDKKRIIDIFQNTRIKGLNPFEDITYTYFTEILNEEYFIKGSVYWVKEILNNLNYFSPIKHCCRNRAIFLMRERKDHTGELVQADGTPYDWFKNGHKYCIQGFVDDATGYPVGLYMTKNECLLGYVEAFRNMAEKNGLPEALYPDKAGVFFVNQKTKDKEKHLTQFGLMMENFGVDMFPAHSPQAKGRIERFWKTIQHRLPNLLRLRGIQTIEEANVFLKNEFPKIYKRWFPVKPKSDKTRFVKADMNEINSILKATFPGHIDKAGVFSLKGYKFFCPEITDRKILIHLNEKEGLWITDAANPKKRYSVKLMETDTTGLMPEVMKDLIDRVFLKNAKPKFREVYFDIDDVVLSQIKPKNKKAA